MISVPAGNLFKVALLATLALKIFLAGILPMSGDEAYFIVWANHPDLGFYDHPPMAGWFLQLLLYLGSDEIIMRLPAIILATLIAIGLYQFLKPYDETKAALVSLLFLISPLNILNVLITTDTPLILFAFLSVMALFKALQQDRMVWYALSGALLGMAFLSKYFAVLLGLAYFIYAIFAIKSDHNVLESDHKTLKNKQKMIGFTVLFVMVIPFVLINVYWNYTHCWDNILFNLYNRHEGDQWSWDKVALFWGAQIYLMTPPVIYFLFRRRSELVHKIRESEFSIFAFVFLLPMGLFALLSLKKVIGLHWVLAFYPFFYVLLFVWLSRDELRKSLKFMAWFTAIHLVAVAAIAMMPMETWKQNSRLYQGMVFMFETDKFVEQVKRYEAQNFVLTTNSYSMSAIFAYHYGKDFSVVGVGSRHARQDDMLTDFREYNGRNVLIVRKSDQ
ncbi:MAG: glycosyltransferase family 39 protein, partial [Gallionella sp.]